MPSFCPDESAWTQFLIHIPFLSLSLSLSLSLIHTWRNDASSVFPPFIRNFFALSCLLTWAGASKCQRWSHRAKARRQWSPGGCPWSVPSRDSWRRTGSWGKKWGGCLPEEELRSRTLQNCLRRTLSSNLCYSRCSKIIHLFLYHLHFPQCIHVINIVVVQSLSYVWLFATPWTAACQASLSFIISLRVWLSKG